MKKLLVFLLLLMMVSCGKKEPVPVYRVAVLTNSGNDTAVIVASDEKGNEIFSADIEYPAEVYFGDEGVYYTANHMDYKSYNYKTHKPGDQLNDIGGTIIYHKEALDTYTYSSINITVYDYKGNRVDSLQDVLMVNHCGENFYVTRGNRDVDVFTDVGHTYLYSINAVSSQYVSFTEIEGKVYLVNDHGFTEIDPKTGELGSTYVYSRPVEEVEGARKNILSCLVNDEYKSYFISFSDHGMIMEELTEKRYYDDSDFREMYREYYDKGYEVEFFNLYPEGV